MGRSILSWRICRVRCYGWEGGGSGSVYSVGFDSGVGYRAFSETGGITKILHSNIL